ncbi:Signal transduction histidine kinase [Chitinophaga sp. YR627]|uniref:ATP-binding protein n=1 Tax=Chitinophaga sp. YR627 TaxID=1881041 RepID=UPI0008E7C21D|nr:ATP-binding protein [Chitinophaga sp. YR627]SFN74338.1 Signal transduction histidine kinase [Chitinophaga sp. YR627]
MNNNRFTYLILTAFLIGTLILAFIQYNSSKNIDQLIKGNQKLLRELQAGNKLRELERDIIWVESRIRAAIATDDTSHIEGVDAKISEVEAFVDTLKDMNTDDSAVMYIERLKYLAGLKLHNKNQLMHEFFRTGRMDDTSLIANPRAREISNEISTVTRKIYDSRQHVMTELSNSINESSRRARNWGIILICLILLTAAGMLWFVMSRIRRQQQLILELDRSEKKIREIAMIKENFMTNMSHEIRTPLNAILGFTNLLKSRKLDESSTEFVGSIQKAGENLLTIINDILDLSKIEAGMVRIESNPFSVRGLLHSIQTLFSEKVKEKKLVLQGEIAADVPDTLIGDATRLTQVLVNLIGNALKFTEKGGIVISVSNKQSDGNIIQLAFAITDTGIGIEPNKLASIFDRFNQAEDSITRKYGGTGLGLSIVKDLVILQGGDISVESEPGKGTTFRFFIPYAIASKQMPIPDSIDISQFRITTNNEVKILVVDDNEMNRSLMKHLFTEWELAFDVASNGMEAIDCLKKSRYDLILMDIQMPEMDGYTATRVIRKEMKLEVPIVAMTAHALAGEREKCLSNGMNEYISKPINEKELYQLINRFAAISNVRQDKPAPVIPPASVPAYQYINLDYMKEISQGNKVYEQKVTRQFIDAMPVELAQLQQAFHNNDITTLRSTAHNLKTTISIMGLTERLSPTLDELESAPAITPPLQIHIDLLKSFTDNAIREAEDFYSQV